MKDYIGIRIILVSIYVRKYKITSDFTSFCMPYVTQNARLHQDLHHFEYLVSAMRLTTWLCGLREIANVTQNDSLHLDEHYFGYRVATNGMQM